MKTQLDVRLECIRLANTLVVSNALQASELIKYANIIHEWVTEKSSGSARDLQVVGRERGVG